MEHNLRRLCGERFAAKIVSKHRFGQLGQVRSASRFAHHDTCSGLLRIARRLRGHSDRTLLFVERLFLRNSAFGSRKYIDLSLGAEPKPKTPKKNMALNALFNHFIPRHLHLRLKKRLKWTSVPYVWLIGLIGFLGIFESASSQFQITTDPDRGPPISIPFIAHLTLLGMAWTVIINFLMNKWRLMVVNTATLRRHFLHLYPSGAEVLYV